MRAFVGKSPVHKFPKAAQPLGERAAADLCPWYQAVFITNPDVHDCGDVWQEPREDRVIVGYLVPDSGLQV